MAAKSAQESVEAMNSLYDEPPPPSDHNDYYKNNSGYSEHHDYDQNGGTGDQYNGHYTENQSYYGYDNSNYDQYQSHQRYFKS